MNLCKNEGFLTSIPFIPIPEYGQSNALLVTSSNLGLLKCGRQSVWKQRRRVGKEIILQELTIIIR